MDDKKRMEREEHLRSPDAGDVDHTPLAPINDPGGSSVEKKTQNDSDFVPGQTDDAAAAKIEKG